MMRSLKSLGGFTRGRGIDENTRNLWVATLHSCAEVEERMCSVTSTSHQSSGQHEELGRSGCQRDYKDLLKFHDWLKQFNPFDEQDKKLRSLDSRLVAKEVDAVNCHNADATITTSKKIKT